MKMSRFMAVLFISSVVVNVNAAEYITLQRAYQAAKDPATRAAIIRRMQAAQIYSKEQWLEYRLQEKQCNVLLRWQCNEQEILKHG